MKSQRQPDRSKTVGCDLDLGSRPLCFPIRSVLHAIVVGRVTVAAVDVVCCYGGDGGSIKVLSA